jgi:hypothetical protein
MTVVESNLWSDFEAFPIEFNENDFELHSENDCELYTEKFLQENVIQDKKHNLFEFLLNCLKKTNIDDFVNLDWKCLSAMKGLSLNFIRENFRYFNVYILITCNNFDENFLTEILDGLIPFNETHFNMIFDKARIINVYKKTNTYILSEQFNSRVYPACNIVYKEFKESNRTINVSFENIVNYIKQEHPKEYRKLDVKCFSSFKSLSSDFVLTHIDNLNINMLFTHQKFDLDFIRKLNTIVDIPFNCLFISHKKILSIDFILELMPFEKILKHEKIIEKFKKNSLSLT